MSKNPVVSLRIAPDTLSRIDALVGTDGANRTEVIVNLIHKALTPSADTSAILSKLEQIEGLLEGDR